mmetsp:Transcript_11213/g.23673  ORF Transcript_11213/g.23673 Transcript_11213/m.23673 type:complete len:88 (-) Transcript_11213:108-371(-)
MNDDATIPSCVVTFWGLLPLVLFREKSLGVGRTDLHSRPSQIIYFIATTDSFVVDKDLSERLGSGRGPNDAVGFLVFYNQNGGTVRA